MNYPPTQSNIETIINILTRTSKRPIGFGKNRASIIGQSIWNINHIVCTDDYNSIPYIEDSGIGDLLYYTKGTFEQCVSRYSEKLDQFIYPHNLYFNKMLEHTLDGWVLFLDDDDRLYDSDSIEKLAKVIKQVNEDTMVFFQMEYANGHKLPPTENLVEGFVPVKGQIGGSCFAFHTKWNKHCIWDGYSCSDFRVIEKLMKVIPERAYIQEPLVYVHSSGFGNQKDII